MNARIALVLPSLLALSLVACSVDVTNPDPGTGGSSVGTSPTTDAAKKPEVGFSCGGQAKALSAPVLETGVSVRCVGAGPDSGTFGSNCAPPAPSCGAQDVTFRYEPPAMRCMGIDMFFWDGKACVAQNTHGEGGMLVCKGADCDKITTTKAACEAAHEGCPK